MTPPWVIAARLARIRLQYIFAVDGCSCDTHPCTSHEEDLAFLLDLVERQQAAVDALTDLVDWQDAPPGSRLEAALFSMLTRAWAAARLALADLHDGQPGEPAP